MKNLTVIVPCFNEEEALPIYYKEMCKVMDHLDQLEGEEH